MTERIRWQSSGIAFYGDIGTLNGRAFTIWRPGSMRSDDVGVLVTDPDEGVLVTLLPGMEDGRYCSKDEAELKAEAERWLAEFISSLGAVFPEALLKLAGEAISTVGALHCTCGAGSPDSCVCQDTTVAWTLDPEAVREAITAALAGTGKGNSDE